MTKSQTGRMKIFKAAADNKKREAEIRGFVKELKCKLLKRTIVERQGTEGPSYDPYHYDEISILERHAWGRNQTESVLTVHTGLGGWIKFEESIILYPGCPEEERIRLRNADYIYQENYEEIFEILGYDKSLMKMLDKFLSKDRCRKCGCKKGKPDEEGFGTVCVRCGYYIYFEDPMGSLASYK